MKIAETSCVSGELCSFKEEEKIVSLGDSHIKCALDRIAFLSTEQLA